MPNTPSGGREHEHFTTESTIVVRKSRNMTVGVFKDEEDHMGDHEEEDDHGQFSNFETRFFFYQVSLLIDVCYGYIRSYNF